MSFVTERLDLSPVQIPTVFSFYFDLLRNPEQRKLEIFCTTLLLNLCKFPKFTHALFSDWHLIFSHLIWHMNCKAEFIQISFQCSADFIQPSFHLFCDVATLSSAEASLCGGEAGEKEKESIPAFYFFDYFILMGIPSGSLCGGERCCNKLIS